MFISNSEHNSPLTLRDTQFTIAKFSAMRCCSGISSFSIFSRALVVSDLFWCLSDFSRSSVLLMIDIMLLFVVKTKTYSYNKHAVGVKNNKEKGVTFYILN